MFNLPEKKENPILGLAGMGGGVGSNLVSGFSPPKMGEAIFYQGYYDWYTSRGFTFTFPNGYDKFIAVLVSGGGGAGTLGGGGGGSVIYTKTPFDISTYPVIFVQTGGRGEGKHNTNGVAGGDSFIKATNASGNTLLGARGGKAGEHNPSSNDANTWRSSQWAHAYSDVLTLSATTVGGHGGGGSGATSGGGSINAGGGGAGGWASSGNNGVNTDSGRSGGNNGSFVPGKNGEAGGAGGGAGNNGQSSDPGGGGGGGVNIYPPSGYQSGRVGSWGANGGGYTGGFGGANSYSHQGSGATGSGGGSSPTSANGGGTAITYPSGGGTLYFGKSGQDATTSKSGDGGFPGGASGSGNRAGDAGDGGGGAVRIIFWNDSFAASTGAPAWPTTRTGVGDITEEHFLNNVHHPV